MVEVKKEANNKIVNIDDKKILLGLFAVFLIGSLFSGNLTGNAGRVKIVQQLGDNEFNLYEGSSQIYKGNAIVLQRVVADGSIIASVVTDYRNEQRMIKAGDEIYINGHYVTNVAANPVSKTAIIRIR